MGEAGRVDVPERQVPSGGGVHFRLWKAGHYPLEVEIPQYFLMQDQLRWPPEGGRFLRFRPVVVTAVFHTRPQGASLFVERGGVRREYLGRSGESLQLNLGNLVGDRESGYFEVTIELEGYRADTVPISNQLLGEDRPNRWPQSGSYALQASSPTIVFLRENSVLLASLALFFGVVWVGWLGPFLKARQALVLRAKTIEEAVSMPEAYESLSTRRLAGYRVFDKLGSGGMATVYRARAEDGLESDEALAIKVLRPSARVARRFRKEVSNLLRLRHPNILRLDDWGEYNGLLYLVTELVVGRTLREEMERIPGPRPELIRCVLEAMRGAIVAHDGDILHCDIKPENILLSDFGDVKLADFGLSRIHDRQSAIEDLEVAGTVGYLAPEVFGGQPPRAASDQYAFGVVCYELLTRELPFPPVPGTLLSPRQLGFEAENPTQMNPQVPLELEKVVMRMLRRRPEERYGSLEEARRALESSLPQHLRALE